MNDQILAERLNSLNPAYAEFLRSDFITETAQNIGVVNEFDVDTTTILENGLTDKQFETNVLDDYKDNTVMYFVTSILLTEHNVRSGAIYGEIEGGEATGLMLSILIASIAILIVGIMVSKIL